MNPASNPNRPGWTVVRWMRGLITRMLARPLPRKPDARHYRAAIVKVDLIGDFVLALSAIRMALNHYGEEDCLLVVSPQAEPLAAAEFPRSPRLLLPPSVGHKRLLFAGWKARRLFQSIHCDEVVCLRHQRWDWDELVLQWLATNRDHVLYDETSLDYYRDRNTHPCLIAPRRLAVPSGGLVMPHEDVATCRELWLHCQLLALVTRRKVSMEEILPNFTLTDSERSDKGTGIGVTPFSSTSIKDIPEELLLQALHELRKLTDEPIFLWGSDDQQPRLKRLAERLRNKGMTNVECPPNVSLVAFVHQVEAVRLVLTVDTVTAHIATALDRPALVLIGGGHHGQFGPWQKSSRQVWLTNRMDCFGCSWNCVHSEPFCLTRIDATKLRSTVAKLWSQDAMP
jgi:ADP-heptose:LPS heptosyltransferase